MNSQIPETPQERIQLFFRGLLTTLIAGGALLGLHSSRGLETSFVAQLVWSLFESVLGTFVFLSLLAIVWALFKPPWLRRTLEREQRIVFIIVALFGLGVLGSVLLGTLLLR